MTKQSDETVILESRLIASATWHQDAGEMLIVFLDGHHKVFPTTRAVFDEFVTSRSPGAYYFHKIKPELKSLRRDPLHVIRTVGLLFVANLRRLVDAYKASRVER